MNIKLTDYQYLSTQQRLIATFEALGRDDQSEVRRLLQSCSRKSYILPDPIFRDKFERILDVALSIEYKLSLLTIYCIVIDDSRPKEYKILLDEMLKIHWAWITYLENEGIDIKSISTLLPRSPAIALLTDDFPRPEPEIISKHLDEIKAFIDAC